MEIILLYLFVLCFIFTVVLPLWVIGDSKEKEGKDESGLEFRLK